MTRNHVKRQCDSADRPDESDCSRASGTAGVNPIRLCSQQRYVKRPKHPGMATFDPTLRRLPLQRGRSHSVNEQSCHQRKLQKADLLVSDNVELVNIGCQPNNNIADLPREFQRPEMPSSVDLTYRAEQRPIDDLQSALLSSCLGSTPKQSRKEESSPPSLSSKTSTISAKQVYQDVRLIYAYLIRENRSFESPLTAVPQDTSTQTWESLHALRQSLLQSSHDFFAITQDLEAPASSKRLASYYGRDATTSYHEYRHFCSQMKCHLGSHESRTGSFIARVRECLQNFTNARLSHWYAADVAIDQYFRKLYDDIAPRSDNPIDRSRKTRNGLSIQNGVPCSNTLDGSLRKWYFKQHPPPDVLSIADVDRLYDQVDPPLRDSVLFVVSGWLYLGPWIAESFHQFCITFKLLVWVGATF